MSDWRQAARDARIAHESGAEHSDVYCVRCVRVARYADGALVQEGDKIRYHQAPGGLLPAGNWVYGTARKFSRREDDDFSNPEELYLFLVNDRGLNRYYGIVGHVVEPVS